MTDDATRELWNWRRAHSDRWLDEHLGIDQPPAFKELQSGRAFDESTDYTPPIDEIQAERTESIIVRIGTIDPDIYEAMVGFWPYNRSEHRIAKDMGKSVRYVKGCLNAGERLYKRMRRG